MGVVEEFFSDKRVVSYYLTYGPLPAEKEVLKRFLKRKGKVLDLCGGAGRVAFYLARKGFDVTVVDNSEEMIKAGKKKARVEGLKIRFVKMDAKDFSSPETFDYVLLMENSLEHVEEREIREEIIRKAYENLVGEGILITSFHPRFYQFRLRSDCIIQVERLKKIEVNKPLYLHLFNPFEIRNLFKKAGFKKLKVIPLNLLDKSNNRFEQEFIYKLIWPFCYTFWIAEK